MIVWYSTVCAGHMFFICHSLRDLELIPYLGYSEWVGADAWAGLTAFPG